MAHHEVMKLFELNLDVQGTGQVVASPDHKTGPGGVKAEDCGQFRVASRMEKGALISDFPTQTSIYRGFSSQPCLITGGSLYFGLPL